MNVLAQEQGQRCINSNLYFFDLGYVVLETFFVTKYVMMTL